MNVGLSDHLLLLIILSSGYNNLRHSRHSRLRLLRLLSSVLAEILLSMNSCHQILQIFHPEAVLACRVPDLHLPPVLQVVAVGPTDLALTVRLLAGCLVLTGVAVAVPQLQAHVIPHLRSAVLDLSRLPGVRTGLHL